MLILSQKLLLKITYIETFPTASGCLTLRYYIYIYRTLGLLRTYVSINKQVHMNFIIISPKTDGSFNVKLKPDK